MDSMNKQIYIQKVMGIYEEPKEQVSVPDKVPEFLGLHNDYYTDRVSDEAILDATTQAYWHSMKLSKERLSEYGLTMKVGRGREDKYSDVRIKKEHNKHGHVSKVMESVKARRIFYKDGHKIYSGSAREICQTDLLESVIEGENVTCPNCGNPGKLSSFIDGCDYCNAKFTVKDLEQKVSGLSFREDVPVKINSFAKRLDAGLRNTFIGVPAAYVVIKTLMGMLKFSQGNFWVGWNHVTTGLAVGAISVYFGIFILVAVNIVSIINKIWINKTVAGIGERVTYSDMPGKKIDNFFAQDFAQNLEWKLKSILLTEGMEKINSFVKCDITDLAPLRIGVVDSSMTSLRINRRETKKELYEISAVAVMRNYRYNEGRVSCEPQEFEVFMTCKKDVAERPVWALRQHACSKCGGSVDLFDGGVCEYCGEKLDYSNEGWVIKKIQYLGKQKSPYPKLAWKVCKGYIIALAIAFAIMIIGPLLSMILN